MATALPGSSTSVVTANVTRTITVARDGDDEDAQAGAGLVSHPQVADGHQGEHEQGDGAADGGDGVEVEADGEDDGDRRGQEQAGRRTAAEAAPHDRWELPDRGHLLAQSWAG